MAFIPMRNFGGPGVIQDTPSEALPIGTWSDALNVRFVGGHITKMLEELDIPTKLLEPDLARCEQLAMEREHTVVLNGQGIDLKLLREENIGESSAFVAVTDEDEENILSALLARKEGVPKVIALMERLDYESVVSTIGVNNIVSKNMAAVSMIMGNLRKGRILSSSVIGSYAEVIEYVAMETSEITGASLVDLSFPRGSIVGAIVREDEVIIPRGGDRVRPGDRVLIFALKESIPKVEKLLTVKLEYF